MARSMDSFIVRGSSATLEWRLMFPTPPAPGKIGDKRPELDCVCFSRMRLMYSMNSVEALESGGFFGRELGLEINAVLEMSRRRM